MNHRNRLSHIVAVLSLGLAVMCTTARAQVFSAPKNVSNNLDFSFTPQIAVDLSGNIYVVWEDDTANGPSIFFKRSIDGGANFSDPTNLSPGLGSSFNPRIAVDATGSNINVNVVWEDNTPGNGRIFFNRSTDGGATFLPTPVKLSDELADSSSPQIAVDTKGNINVVWENDALDNLGVFFTRSADGFATVPVPTPAMVSSNAAGSVNPQIAVDKNGNINVVWEDHIGNFSDISFSRLDLANNATTFSNPKSLSHNLGNSISPQIAVDLSDNIDVVWENDGPGHLDIFFSRSVDGGANFSITPKNLSNGVLRDSGAPQLALDAGGNINVSWEENFPLGTDPTDIFFARSSAGGATFPPTNVSKNARSSSNARLALDAVGNIDVIWQDNSTSNGNFDIFFARSSDGGATFTPQNLSKDLDNDLGLSSDAQIAVDKNGNINVVWAYFPPRTVTPRISQIFFRRAPGETPPNNQPPVANAGADQTVECAGPGGTLVTLNGSSSSDPDGDALSSFVWKDESNNVVGRSAIVELTLTMGMHTFTLTVTDPGGLSSPPATTRVNVEDTTPPTLQVSLSPNVLWPPNHKLVQVTATVQANDTCDPNPAVELVSITNNDQDHGRGDGNRENDIQAVGGGLVPFGRDVRSFMLRAEHSGKGTGLVYMVTYRTRDASGHTALATAQVRVGKARSGDDDDDEKHEHSRRKR